MKTVENVSIDFKLFPKQLMALNTKAKQILYGGAVGGGKSHLIRISTIIFSYGIPGLQTVLIRKTYPELLDNHMSGETGYQALLQPLIDMDLCSINLSKMEIKFFNGSVIRLRHMSNSNEMWRLSGQEIQYLVADECGMLDPSVIRFLRSRVRLGGLQIPEQFKEQFPRELYCTNPIGPSLSYFKKEFVDNGPPNIIKNGKIYIPAKIQDNKVLLENDPEYLERLEYIGSKELVQALKEGSWDVNLGSFFGETFKREKNTVEQFRLPSNWTVTRSMDWGSSAPCSVLWIAESNGETISFNGKQINTIRGDKFVIAEDYIDNGEEKGLNLSAEELTDRIREDEDKIKTSLYQGKIKAGAADINIFNKESTSGYSIDSVLRKKGIFFNKADKGPNSRVLGAQKLINLFKNAHDNDREKPALFIFSTCNRLIEHITNLQRDSKKLEDCDTNGADHDYDCLRMNIFTKKKAITARQF